MPKRRDLGAVLRLSPLEQRIRDVRAELFWALAEARSVVDSAMGGVAGYSEEGLAAAERTKNLCSKAQTLSDTLLELVQQREVPNG